jgi:alanyl-tRNA synthetase
MMLFGEKYGDTVRMVTMGAGAEGEGQPGQDAVSIELCGGTHVARTGRIGLLLVTGEEAVSAGVRRVTALAGEAALAYVRELRDREAQLASELGGRPDELTERVGKLQGDLKAARREAADLREKLAEARTGAGDGGAQGREIEGVGTLVVADIEGLDAGALRNAADTTLGKSKADVVVLASGEALVVRVGEAARERGVKAGDLARGLAKRAGGGGGGRPDMAQAGAKDAAKLSAVLTALREGELDAELFGA